MAISGDTASVRKRKCVLLSGQSGEDGTMAQDEGRINNVRLVSGPLRTGPAYPRLSIIFTGTGAIGCIVLW